MNGLSSERPDNTDAPEILGEYQLAMDQDALRCSFCAQHTKHRKGFVARFGDAEVRYAIGSTCGPKHLGVQFGSAKRSHNDLISRQGYLRRIDRILGDFDQHIARCDAALFSDELKALIAKANEIEKVAGDAFMRLRAVSLQGGILTEFIQLRDYEAEQRRDEKLGDGREGSPIFRSDAVAIGPLSGGVVFETGTLSDDIFLFKGDIQALKKVMFGDTNALSTTKLKNIVDGIENSHGKSDDAIRRINMAHQFFAKSNLDRLARWSSSGVAERLSAGTGGMQVSRKNGAVVLIKALAASKLKALLPLRAD